MVAPRSPPWPGRCSTWPWSPGAEQLPRPQPPFGPAPARAERWGSSLRAACSSHPVPLPSPPTWPPWHPRSLQFSPRAPATPPAPTPLPPGSSLLLLSCFFWSLSGSSPHVPPISPGLAQLELLHRVQVGWPGHHSPSAPSRKKRLVLRRWLWLSRGASHSLVNRWQEKCRGFTSHWCHPQPAS